jgi:hypothetical protein
VLWGSDDFDDGDITLMMEAVNTPETSERYSRWDM